MENLCNDCGEPFNVNHLPRIMPCCDSTLCHRCIGKIQIKNNHYRCISCNEEKEIPRKGFPFNRNISLDLLATEEAKQKSETSRLLAKLRNEFQKVKSTIENHYDEQKKKFDLKGSQILKAVDDYEDSLFEKLDKYKEECIENYFKKDNIEWFKMVTDSLNEKISNIELTSNNANLTILSLKQEAEKELVGIKSIMFKKNLAEFESKHTQNIIDLLPHNINPAQV